MAESEVSHFDLFWVFVLGVLGVLGVRLNWMLATKACETGACKS